MIFNAEQWSVAFLRNEPEYDEPAWIDVYAMAFGRSSLSSRHRKRRTPRARLTHAKAPGTTRRWLPAAMLCSSR
jgi:hypothetical protein